MSTHEIGDHLRGLKVSAATPHRPQHPPTWVTGYYRTTHPHAPGTVQVAITPGSTQFPPDDVPLPQAHQHGHGEPAEHLVWVFSAYLYPPPRSGAPAPTGSAPTRDAPIV